MRKFQIAEAKTLPEFEDCIVQDHFWWPAIFCSTAKSASPFVQTCVYESFANFTHTELFLSQQC